MPLLCLGEELHCCLIPQCSQYYRKSEALKHQQREVEGAFLHGDFVIRSSFRKHFIAFFIRNNIWRNISNTEGHYMPLVVVGAH